MTRFECIIPYSKIHDYLLNLEHPVGGPKARFFLAGGFSRYYRTPLVVALERHVQESPIETEIDRFGKLRLVADGPMWVPDGRAPFVRTVWRPETFADLPVRIHLITAMPKSK